MSNNPRMSSQRHSDLFRVGGLTLAARCCLRCRRALRTGSIAAALVMSVCLGSGVVAQAAEGRSATATADDSTAAESFCVDLQREITAERTRFSGWRCKPGPTIRGHETILAWVKATAFGGKPHLELIWLAWTQPVVDAQLIDALLVPHYGYEPSNVQQAFRIADV
jgi:hypothetical protein